MAYRLAEVDGDKASSWSALTKARQLAPDNPRFEAMSLLVAVWSLSPLEADAYIAGVRGRIEHSGAEVCLMYALAEINLAKGNFGASAKQRWRRARDAADAGLIQARSEEQRFSLKAIQLITQELLAGREPTVAVLYLAGLSD